ncbi:NAD(P)H-dependent oxidoreductase [Neisseria bacilliformis]|uniref:NAD(P)H-dependent oxidoreductase n=1 Tax=Neisseria bacilliformis TaxID=267212 RepID=UPI00066518E8|nr:NAD(P)H-dependent oxidoreductase [Neisseria bacilliformis]
MPADKQTVLDAFHLRHACKKYDPSKKISRADFDFILETARLSPSSFGLEPWRFLVIQNPALRKELRGIASGAAEKLDACSHFVILLSRKQAALQADYRSRMWGAVQGMPAEAVEMCEAFFQNFAEHDFRLNESPRAFDDWEAKQTYIALANMMTAATLIGIDSTPMEGFDMAAANRLLAEKGLMNPDEFQVAVMAAFGYRADEPRGKTRLSAEEMIEWVE